MKRLTQAQIKEIQNIHSANHNNVLQAQAVLKHAKNAQSALHNWFDWDDCTAAEKHRLYQARKLIKCYLIVIDRPKVNSQKPKRLKIQQTPIAGFVSLSTDRVQKGGGYRELQTVLKSPEMRSQ